MSHTTPQRAFEDLPEYPWASLAEVPVVDQVTMIEVDRLMEQDYGISLIQMMENAGRCLARLAQSVLPHPTSRVLVLAGRGGNGGGGLTAARRLAGWGYGVDVVLSSPAASFQGVPAHQLKSILALGIAVQERLPAGTDDYQLIVDAMVGYALSGDPRGWLAEAIALINARPIARCLSLDVPSGFDSRLGHRTGTAVRPDAILTIAAPKTGLIEAYPATPIFLADISVPASLFAATTGASFAPPADISRVS